MKPRILLIQPPIRDFYQTRIRIQPVGLCYLAASVEMHIPTAEIKILDGQAEGKKHVLPFPREFDYLKQFYNNSDTGPLRIFQKFYHFGLSYKEIRDRVELYNPDIVGISNLFSPYYRIF